MNKEEQNSIKCDLSPVQSLLCGFGGIIVPRTLLAPMESIKLMRALYGKNVYSHFKDQINNEGFVSLWHGYSCDWIRIPIQSICRYLLYNQIRSSTTLKVSIPIADNISAALSSAMLHPIEVIHTLMVSNPGKYQTIAHTAAYLIKNDGFTGFFRGLTPTLLGYIPNRSVQLASYYILQKYPIKPTMGYDFLIGSAITTIAHAASYPFEVARRRMMADESVRNMNFVDVWKDTVRTRGITGLYSGFGFSMLRVLPITWLQRVATRELRTFLTRFNYHMELHKFEL